MLERWAIVAQAPDYEISSHGQVRRAVTGMRGRKPGPIKLHADRVGRHSVRLYVNGKKKSLKVHRLVCEAFNGPPPSPDAIVAHFDDVPSNNIFTNLRWTDYQGNADDRERLGTVQRGEDASGAKLTTEDVRRIRRSRLSIPSLAKTYSVNPETIRRIKRRLSWTHV